MMRAFLKHEWVRQSAAAALLAAAVIFIYCPTAVAQCPLCRAAAEGLNDGGAKSLNLAILMLLTPPVAIFCAFFYVAYKHRNAPGESSEDESS